MMALMLSHLPPHGSSPLTLTPGHPRGHNPETPLLQCTSPLVPPRPPLKGPPATEAHLTPTSHLNLSYNPTLTLQGTLSLGSPLANLLSAAAPTWATIK